MNLKEKKIYNELFDLIEEGSNEDKIIYILNDPMHESYIKDLINTPKENKDEEEETILMFAIWTFKKKVVEVLIQKG